MFHLLADASAYSAPRVVASFETFESAEAHVRATYTLICFELDADHAGCADLYTSAGQVMAIEPADRRARL